MSNSNSDVKAPPAMPESVNVSSRWELNTPSLAPLGIKRIRLPSKKWLLFWAVTGSLIGGYVYDQHERHRIKEMWKERVAPLAVEPIGTTAIPRKVKVYLAPPPNDFLDTTQAHFRNYIKPVLTAAAVDHEIIEEKQQGHIRTRVANEIRLQRCSGAYQQADEIEKRIMRGIERDNTGGVIIVGRGAFKEYMAGLQEGWLGPLEEPQAVREAKELAAKAQGTFKARFDAQNIDEYCNDAGKVEDNVLTASDPEVSETTEEDRYNEEINKKYPVEPEWIRSSDYSALQLPENFNSDPLAILRLPRLLGGLMFPWRMYRFFTQRFLADEMGRDTAAVVLNLCRRWQPDDVHLAATDEDDWPPKFKQQGLDRDAEWMRELVVDPRIGEKLRVYSYHESEQ